MSSYLRELQKNWNEFGNTDPLWTILTDPAKKNYKWNEEEFFNTGIREIECTMSYVKSIKDIRYGKVLDFGCGVGRLTQALSNYFDETYGIDIASSMIDLANKYNTHQNCHFILNESNDLRLFDDNSFDFIYSNIVLQHISPKYSKNYIKEFIRVLAPGGIIIFQIPSEVNMTVYPRNKFARLLIKMFGNNHFMRNILYDIFNIMVQLYNSWHITEYPKMDIYGIRKHEIMKLIKKNNGVLIDVQEDHSTCIEWIGHRYCITK